MEGHCNKPYIPTVNTTEGYNKPDVNTMRGYNKPYIPAVHTTEGYNQTAAHNLPQQDLGFKTHIKNTEAVQSTSVPEHIFNKLKEVFWRNPLGLSIEMFRGAYVDIDGLTMSEDQLGLRIGNESLLQHLARINLIELKYVANVLMVMPGPTFIKHTVMPGNAVIKHASPFVQVSTNRETRPERKRLDVMGPGDKISPQGIPPDLKVGDFLEVIIAEVFNPNRFWIQLKGETTSAVLEAVMDEMDVLYDGHESEQYRIADDCVVVGLVCASLYGVGDWHRAYVKSMVNLSTVEVFYLDYGTVGKVKKDSLRYLPKRFAQLPGQGIEARLAAITPEGGLRRFTNETSYRFLQLVRMPPGLVGLVAVIKGLAPKLSLWLVDTSTNDLPEGVSINQVLVDEGLAEAEDLLDQDSDVIQKKTVVNHLVPLRRPAISSKSNTLEFSTIHTVNTDPPPANTPKSDIGEIQAKMDMLATWIKSAKDPDIMCQLKSQFQEEHMKKLMEKTNPENKEKCLPNSNRAGDNENSYINAIRPLKVPGHSLHKLILDGAAWMTSYQISQLIPNWKGRDLLTRMLKLKRLSVESKVVTTDGNPALFEALMESELVQGEVQEVWLYPIKTLPHILNILLPAPATELNKALQEEIHRN